MNKHFKLFSALLVLMLLAPVSMFVCPADAGAAQTLVENSWRYEGGQLVSDDASSEERNSFIVYGHSSRWGYSSGH